MNESLRKTASDAAKFSASVAVTALVLWYALGITSLYPLKAFSALAASGVLSTIGLNNTIVINPDNPLIVVGKLRAGINDLCAGDVEIAVLTAALASTFDRKKSTRIKGIIAGLTVIVIANPLRIAIVIWSAHSQGLATADFVHNVLFRITLFATIAGYYAIWYYVTGRKK